jgi:hypothetical protein
MAGRTSSSQTPALSAKRLRLKIPPIQQVPKPRSVARRMIFSNWQPKSSMSCSPRLMIQARKGLAPLDCAVGPKGIDLPLAPAGGVEDYEEGFSPERAFQSHKEVPERLELLRLDGLLALCPGTIEANMVTVTAAKLTGVMRGRRANVVSGLERTQLRIHLRSKRAL